MQKMDTRSQKATRGGYYWKCQHSYHSSWANNTFVSRYYFTWAGANSRRAEHVKTYDHATDKNTWVTIYGA